MSGRSQLDGTYVASDALRGLAFIFLACVGGRATFLTFVWHLESLQYWHARIMDFLTFLEIAVEG